MKRYIPLFLLATSLATSAFAADAPSIGVVNFSNCVTDSKLGKQEQSSFDALKKQMSTLLEDTEKQLNDIAAKFNDPEYLDGLSPEAEEELKNKFRVLSDEMNRYQNQYYQVLNQANMRIIQTISNGINTASEKVAKDKKLTVVVNKDACFYFSPGLDVTNQVVSEMDKTFESETKKQAAAAPAVPALTNETKTK
ncbi:MAG: OmpH family outer membrane protein [Parachlamydiales bacterium]|jgi:outer membrane protein|nr:OmpH family outer membrane protein [Verrucomicrobiota bacterium]MBX3719346.1 OmpH family outer membrane protein [Candidatus Acheromyda pituitae]